MERSAVDSIATSARAGEQASHIRERATLTLSIQVTGTSPTRETHSLIEIHMATTIHLQSITIYLQ